MSDSPATPPAAWWSPSTQHVIARGIETVEIDEHFGPPVDAVRLVPDAGQAPDVAALLSLADQWGTEADRRHADAEGEPQACGEAFGLREAAERLRVFLGHTSTPR